MLSAVVFFPRKQTERSLKSEESERERKPTIDIQREKKKKREKKEIRLTKGFLFVNQLPKSKLFLIRSDEYRRPPFAEFLVRWVFFSLQFFFS